MGDQHRPRPFNFDPTTRLAYQLLGRSLLDLDRAYWAVKLKNDIWVCEARVKKDEKTGLDRNFEWYEDLVANDDVKDITELWLFCPANKLSPLGNTARIPIIDPYSAFSFKRSHVSSNLVHSWKQHEFHVIGRVLDKQTGDCFCFIWDDKYQVMTEPYYTSIFNFKKWRSDMHEIGPLAYEKMGVRLS